MDVQAVTSLISTVGFPIVACIYMAYLVKDMNEKHASETDTLKESINANTQAISELKVLINTLLGNKKA